MIAKDPIVSFRNKTLVLCFAILIGACGSDKNKSQAAVDQEVHPESALEKTADEETSNTEADALSKSSNDLPPLNQPQLIAPKNKAKNPDKVIAKSKTEQTASTKTTQIKEEKKAQKTQVKEENTKPKDKIIEEKEISAPAKPPKETPAIPDIKPEIRKPIMSFEKTTYDFGRIVQGDVIQTKINFINTGNAPLEVVNASASCGCTRPTFPFLPIGPGERGYIGVEYNSTGKLGPQNPEIRLYTNISPEPVKVYLKGVVLDKPAVEASAEKDSMK